MRYPLGFLGAGNMAEAIARAAVREGVLSPDQLIVSDPSPPRQQVFNEIGVTACDDNRRVIRDCDQVMLAVKPQVVQQLAGDLAEARPDQVIISIMAGVTTASLEATIGRAARVIRVMPNTPVLVGCGMAGVAMGAHAEHGDEGLTMRLFGATGRVILVDEADLDAVTAVSGSGPAYVFYLAEAMQAAVKELGLGDHAPLLVGQTILGAAKLLAESDGMTAGHAAADLRRRVTSPGGTTEAAIETLEQGKFMTLMADAMKAACQRSRELGG